MTQERPPIIWMASYPKSGSTWLRLFLAAYDMDARPNINSLPLRFSLSDAQPYVYQSVSPFPLERLPDEALLQLRGAALIHLWALGVKIPVLVKTHMIYGIMNGVMTIPSPLTRKVVYLVRDPRDVALSLSRHVDKSVPEAVDFMLNQGAIIAAGDTVGYGGNVFSGLRTWGHHVDAWQAAPFEILCIRYEDMCERPAEVFSNVLRFCEFEVDAARVRRAVANTEFGVLQAQEREHGFTEAGAGQKFFHTGGPGNWVGAMDPEQIDRIEKAFPEQMKRCGYKALQEILVEG